ncbi:hypothetical protein [Prosthecobacter sp.]|uniref:hypothetical protein n=1 Tax=Prosthecobacter sp. TaxID=1965333 RepID=UPI002486D433|nr:hypothetical protein [Prosthecobacter sp.]MDI1313928.1 hypothetical protein [Prosthecobacter sp.]
MVLFDFIATLLEAVLSICMKIGEFFDAILHADKSLKENSLIGESEFDRETRRSWRRWGAGILILLILAAITALLAWLWW